MAQLEIPLSRGMVALIDAADLPLIEGNKWYANPVNGGRKFYARRDYVRDGVRGREMMHRLILQPPAGLEIDHINGDALDNRRANLRICTRQQNLQSRRRPSNNSTGAKGVSFEMGKFRACIWQGRTRHLGFFDTLEEAKAAYDAAAKAAFGEFFVP